MSELSTVAIKDGHRGHPHHHHAHRQQPSAAEGADAERADRISRLAGLERVATVRQSSQSTSGGTATTPSQGYFDPPTAPSNTNKERSTVGSASATGSVGGRTTWASGSDAFDTADKMSEDQDMDASSTGGFSDEGNASLVGFGETASSTVSGPISTISGARTPQRSSLQPPRTGVMPPPSRDSGSFQSFPPAGLSPAAASRQDARMIDGMSHDSTVVDLSAVGPLRSSSGADPGHSVGSDMMDTSIDGGSSQQRARRDDGVKEIGGTHRNDRH